MNEKLASWMDCIDKKSSIKVTPDKFRTKSLVETAVERIKQINKELNEKTADFIFEDYYTSVVEMLEAIALSRGVKIFNHVCLGFFLKEVLNREEAYRIFDDLRFKRNGLVYYGKRMEFETAKKAIVDSKKLMTELTSLTKI